MTALSLGLTVLGALILAGCASLSGAPFNEAQSCQAAGGIYRADGRCSAGLP